MKQLINDRSQIYHLLAWIDFMLSIIYLFTASYIQFVFCRQTASWHQGYYNQSKIQNGRENAQQLGPTEMTNGIPW